MLGNGNSEKSYRIEIKMYLAKYSERHGGSGDFPFFVMSVNITRYFIQFLFKRGRIQLMRNCINLEWNYFKIILLISTINRQKWLMLYICTQTDSRYEKKNALSCLKT